jgi:hypothetical protein
MLHAAQVPKLPCVMAGCALLWMHLGHVQGLRAVEWECLLQLAAVGCITRRAQGSVLYVLLGKGDFRSLYIAGRGCV